MIEIPESTTIGRQAADILSGKTVRKVFNSTSPHKFTFYNGDPLAYPALLEGRQIETAKGTGAYVDIWLEDGVHLAVSDGTNIRHYAEQMECPAKFQLMMTLDDDSALVFTVAMYGMMYAFKSTYDNPYYQGSITKLSPLDERFDAAHFEEMFRSMKKDVSAKAFLATEQRIPGLGNGVLQDILFNAGINPKRKISGFSDQEKEALFNSVKDTLADMTDLGGRDTEKDLFGIPGGYKTILSKNTCKELCPNCGSAIIKEAYLGGAIYYCPHCQEKR